MEMVKNLYGKRISSLERETVEIGKNVLKNSKGIGSLGESLKDYKETTESDILLLKNDNITHGNDIATLNTNVSHLSSVITETKENIDRKISTLSNKLQ